MKFQNVKGTRDFYPDDMALRTWLIERWRAVSRCHGFLEYDGPTFEYLDLYKAKSGDGIVSELFHFEDRGGRHLALRPEMTPTFARMVAARANTLPKPIKWFAVPNFFRAERPQRGRLREFWQWNADIVTAGDDEVLADAECLFVSLDLLRSVGLTPADTEMRISSRAVMAQLFETMGIDGALQPAVTAILDKRGKVPADVFSTELGKVGLHEPQVAALEALGAVRGAAGLAELTARLGGSGEPGTPLGHLRRLFEVLEAFGVAEFCVFDPTVVRGLAYYTGVIFEAYGMGSLNRAILGGGRYGQLLAALGGPPLSGVGFGMGDVVLLEHLEELGRRPAPAQAVEFFVALDRDQPVEAAIAVVGLLRRSGRSCSFSYRDVSLKKQMQQANQAAARWVVIAGGAAGGNEALTIKDLRSGTQFDCALAALEARLQEAPLDGTDAGPLS